jgi:hypothetical protein
MHNQRLRHGLSLIVLCTALAGCTQFEPFQREGTWHQNDAPMHNIAAELVNPQDLYRGTSDPVMTGMFATNAIGASADAGASSGAAAGSGAATGASTAGASTGSSSSSGTGSSGGLGGASVGTGSSASVTGGSMQ